MGLSATQERLLALQAQQREQTLAFHRSRVGSWTPVLVEGVSRRGDQHSGRCPFNRIVNFVVDDPEQTTKPGDMVSVRLVGASPHSQLGEIPSPSRSLELPLAAMESA